MIFFRPPNHYRRKRACVCSYSQQETLSKLFFLFLGTTRGSRNARKNRTMLRFHPKIFALFFTNFLLFLKRARFLFSFEWEGRPEITFKRLCVQVRVLNAGESLRVLTLHSFPRPCEVCKICQRREKRFNINSLGFFQWRKNERTKSSQEAPHRDNKRAIT